VPLPTRMEADVSSDHSRTALVTGAGSGICASVARALADDGVRVALAGRRREPLVRLAAQLDDAVAVVGDITTDADRIVAEAVAALGRLQVLVNNAGAIRRNLRVHEIDDETWDAQLALKLTAHFRVGRVPEPPYAEVPHPIVSARGEPPRGVRGLIGLRARRGAGLGCESSRRLRARRVGCLRSTRRGAGD